MARKRGAAAAACDRHDGPTTGGRKALAVDRELREGNLKRLRRIEGQVRGLQSMVEADRYCPDVLVQISAVQAALHAVGKELLRNHLRHCAGAALAQGGEHADAMREELLELVFKHVR